MFEVHGRYGSFLRGALETAVIILILCSGRAAFAQQRHELALFVSDSNDSNRVRGYGAAFNEAWTPHFSTQIAAGVEDPETCIGGSFLVAPCTTFKVRTYPIDFSGRYHFLNETRWKPYIGAGLRYVRAPKLTPEAIAANRGRGYPDRFDPQFVGGVEFLVKPSFGIAVDGKVLGATSAQYDPILKISASLNWRF